MARRKVPDEAEEEMKCIDCEEVFSEKEYKRAWHCMECEGPMHVECAMEDPSGKDLCEYCFNRSSKTFEERAAPKGRRKARA